MTQEEENLCQRAYDLRRASEVTFKTIDKLKHQSARRVQSTPGTYSVYKKLSLLKILWKGILKHITLTKGNYHPPPFLIQNKGCARC